MAINERRLKEAAQLRLAGHRRDAKRIVNEVRDEAQPHEQRLVRPRYRELQVQLQAQSAAVLAGAG